MLADLSSTWQALRRELLNPTTDDALVPRSVVHPPRPSGTRRVTTRRTRRRLSENDVRAIICHYQSGISSAKIAKSYGIGKQTVLGLLKQHGVQRRCQPMTGSQVAEAKRLYETGLSVSAVSQLLEVPWTTVERALRRAGAAMRPRGRLLQD